jgi:ketosteroid isomerase-like protein
LRARRRGYATSEVFWQTTILYLARGLGQLQIDQGRIRVRTVATEVVSEDATAIEGAPALAPPCTSVRPLRAPKPGAQQQSKEAVVRELFDCFSRRDVQSALALLHPSVVFQPMTAEVTRAGEPYRGHDGIRCYVEDVEAHWQRLVVNPTQIRAAGRAVVVLGLVSGAGPGGSFADVPTTWVLKFTDGRVSHAQIFADARHVNEALGVACVSASATELS